MLTPHLVDVGNLTGPRPDLNDAGGEHITDIDGHPGLSDYDTDWMVEQGLPTRMRKALFFIPAGFFARCLL
jgi:hypothetical protein